LIKVPQRPSAPGILFLLGLWYSGVPNKIMKSIILASASAQRKNLLKTTGLKFKVITSRVHEEHRITSTCKALVKHNALLKARDVAGRVRCGIVIAADTVVYGGGRKIIGKPRDLREARQVLKNLFSRPHWVYTGVAVVDVKSGKTVLDCEKTKVFMHHLSDAEIARYHDHTPPMDKAGGFDIEGRGGLFIRRIEGCYSNVIGLPMAKLRLMLKKLDIEVL
jgi:septum formation protein